MRKQNYSSVLPNLAKNSFAMMAGMLSILSFDMADTFYISMLGKDSLLAVSYATPFTQTLLSITIGLTISVSIIQERLLDPDNLLRFRQFSINAAIITIFLSLFIFVLLKLFLPTLSVTVDEDPLIQSLVYDYMHFWLLGYPAFSLLVILNQTIRSRGSARFASQVLIMTAILNITLDPIFIFHFNLGISGAPISSLVSFLFGILISVHHLITKGSILNATKLKWLELLDNAKKLAKRSTYTSASVMIDPIIMAVLILLAANISTSTVAAVTIGIKIDLFLRIFSLSISRVIPTLFGYYIRSGKIKCAILTVKAASLVNCIIYFPTAGILAVFSHDLDAIFTDEPDVLALSSFYLLVVPISYAFKGLSIAIFQYFHCIDKSAFATLININLSMVIIATTYIGYYLDNEHGLIIGYSSGCIAYGLSMLLLFNNSLIKRSYLSLK